MRKSLIKKVSTKKYYSFFVGLPRSPASEWILLDDKLPAASVFQAICFHYWIKNNDSFFKARFPASLSISNLYRCVVEFERVEGSHKGFTIVQFKKVRSIPSHIFLKDFK